MHSKLITLSCVLFLPWQVLAVGDDPPPSQRVDSKVPLLHLPAGHRKASCKTALLLMRVLIIFTIIIIV